MLIPSKDFWTRSQFLAARKAQMQAHENGEVDCLCDDPMFANAEEIVIDAGDEIICDSCNAGIEDDIINLVQWGRRVVCDECYQKSYAQDLVEYRELKADGSLGEVVGVKRV